ncbi:hypothetical protein KJ966_20665 [bacterium]|nr:hypothetical protein [bacterium]
MIKLNPWRFWQQRKREKLDSRKFRHFCRLLKKHPLMPLFQNRLDLPDLEKRFVKGNRFAIEVIQQMNEAKSYHPIPLGILIEADKAGTLKWMEEPKYQEVIPPLVSLALSAFVAKGTLGLKQVVDIIRERELARGLYELRHTYYIRQSGLKRVFQSAEETIYRLNDLNSLAQFFRYFIHPDGFNALRKIICPSSYSNSGVVIQTLRQMLLALPEFQSVQHMRQGLEVLKSSNFSLIAKTKCIILTPYCIFFGKCFQEYGCHMTELVKAIEWVCGTTHNVHLIHDFERKVVLMLQLEQQAVPSELISRIKHSVNAPLEMRSQTLLRELLIHHNTDYDESILDVWLILRETSLSVWKDTQVSSKQYFEYFQNDIEYCQHLVDWIKKDQKSLFLKMAKMLSSQPAGSRPKFFKTGFYLLENTHSLALFETFLKLLQQKTLNLDTYIPDSLGHWKREEKMNSLIDICLTLWLSELLDEHGYELTRYLAQIKVLLAYNNTPELQAAFYRGLEKTLRSGVNLDEWLEGARDLYHQNANAWDTESLNHVFELKFEEVKSFLNRYSVSLFGNVPLMVTKDEFPSTNGKQVFLPQSHNQYPDSKADLYENRNASLFVASLFHEVGYHIQAGTFLVDSQPTIERFPNGTLAHLILNIMEDFRGREHFFAHPYNNNWLELIKEDESLIVQGKEIPDGWADHFMQLLVCKGCVGLTPGDFCSLKKKAEDRLLSRSCTLFLPPDGREITTSLKSVLELIISKIQTLKGKTVAHSLLLVKPIYQIISQVIGEQITIKANHNVFELDVDAEAGQDAFTEIDGISSGDREFQLRELAHRIMPYQEAFDVPKEVIEAKAREKQQQNYPSAIMNVHLNSNQTLLPNTDPAEKVYVGQYDAIQGIDIQSPFPVIFQKESRSHPQYQQIFRKYGNVFKAMEEAVTKLLVIRESVEMDGRDPDELMIENLIEGIVDPQCIPFLELYENDVLLEKENRVDMEVKLLVDASGSTNGRILEIEKVFASVLYRAFELLGFDVSLYFFNSNKNTFITEVSNLDAIGRIKSSNSNRDGVAIRYVTGQFKFQKDHSLLIVISDGFPADEGYEGRLAIEDTCYAMKKAADKNIMVRYFNIGGLPEEILEAFKAHTKHTSVFYDPKELIAYAPQFMEELVNELSVCV